jgi:membrane protease YdiL (CAAX protease family)
MFDIELGIVDIVFLIVAAASAGTWVWLFRTRIAKKLPLIEPQERPRPFWTMSEFFVCFGLQLVCALAGFQTGKRWFTPELREKLESGSANANVSFQDPQDVMVVMVINLIAMVASMLSVLVWMNLVSRRRLSFYGFLPSWADVKLGCIAAFLVLPHVLLLSVLIGQFIKYEHPVLDTIGADVTWQVLSLQLVLTVLIAPFFEEFTFRGLLQGGAEQIARRLQIAGTIENNPAVVESDPIPATEVATWPWWPVWMSSAVFAIMHMTHGGGAIAIFFLAVAIGYLYRQTGRLGPGLVVHMILNSYSMTLLLLKVFS